MVWYSRLVAAAGVMALANLMPGSVEAQRSGARLGRFEVPGLDFAADGAWRKRTGQIRQTRQALLRSGSFQSLNASGASATRVTGNYNVPVVLISYSNVALPFPTSAFTDVLFNPAPDPGVRPYSVKTYYEQISRGAITMNGVVFDAVVADSLDTYYEDGCDGIGLDPTGNPTTCDHPLSNGVSARFGELLIEVLSKLDDGSVDWGQFDNDGPDGLPNSLDDDGFVDFLSFIQPEVDGACGTSNIWAHRFVIAGVSGSNYVTTTPRPGGGFVVVRDYTIQSGQGGSGSCTGGQIMPIGTIAHETGHAFGLPDLYDTDGSSEGIGEWGIMGSGNYARSTSPSAFEAWSLAEMGWVTVDTLTTSRTVTINSVQVSDTVFYVPLAGTDEYLLLENRDSLLSDTAQMNGAFGTRRKSPGLLIWHIDRSVVNAGMASNMVNAGTTHGVGLEQADGLNNLRSTTLRNRGDAGDSYPGSSMNRAWSTTSTPAARNNSGGSAGFVIDSIYRNSSVTPGVPSPIVLRFVKASAVAVATADAVNALLGVSCSVTPCLSSQQTAYLDLNGNNDGVYNLGDFLAHADRSGLNPSSELMRRVLSQPTIAVPLSPPNTPKER